MPRPYPRKRPRRKQPDHYHHGDLAAAMLHEAVRIIQKEGVAGLTLRGVGEQLGVSRTALYRHFANKEALLGAVAGEGFRTLRTELAASWDQAGRGRPGFDAMGAAYVGFALRHPSHYRVMFGGVVGPGDRTPAKTDDSADAFGVLVDALREQQDHGLVRPGDPRQLALFVWAVVHGVAMLALDILREPGEIEALTAFAIERIRTGIAGGAR